MRIRILRRRINPIIVIFVILIVVLLAISHEGKLPPTKFPSYYTLLLTVLFGLLGACSSVASDLVTRFESSNLFRQFSEVADSLRRISFGPVAALVVVLALNTGFITALKGTTDDNELKLKCCFAFVAGFSERLVMKLFEKVGGVSK